MFKRASCALPSLACVLLALFAWFSPAHAQAPATVKLCNGGQPNCPVISSTNPLPISGSFTANLGGFHTAVTQTPITATTAGVSSTAFTAAQAVLLSNTGTTNTAYCAPGTTATTNSTPVPPGQSVEIQTTTETQVTCATSTGTTTVNVQVGSGLATGWGGSGSGGGGGGGGAVFGPTAVGTAAANPPVLMGGTVDGTATGAVAVQKTVAGVAYENNAQWAGTALGAPSNYGTSPGAVAVPGMNAFVTNTVTTTGAGGTFPVTQSTSPWIVAGGGTAGTPATGVVSIQGVTSGTPVSTSVASSAPEGTTADAPASVPTSTTAASLIALQKALVNISNNPPNLSVSGALQAWTGITPGGTRTGTIYGGDVNISSVNGAAASAVTLGPATDANSVPTTVAPSAATSAALTTSASTVLAASLSVSGAHNLFTFEVSADSTLSGAAWWVMVFDATTPPTGTVTPKKCYAVPSGTTVYSAAWPVAPIAFATGISIAVSTTGCFTATASTHAYFSADYK